ncbi:MAG TPA: hypothetical protein VGR74_19410 [Actinomycetota bacterium]|jgi:hypothetical protein|nr:hypothetical protein [Actinomycetota bacterium]
MSREQAGLFEPAQAGPPPPPPAPAPAGPQRPLWLLLAPALTLVVGAVLGFVLGTTQAHRQPAAAAPTSSAPAPTTQPAPPPSTKVVVRNYASPACLETARRADRLIDLLIRNQRTRVEQLLVPYTIAARQCRQDASPAP